MGIFAPIAVKRSAFFRKSTTSFNSNFAPSIPATSPKVTWVWGSICTLAFDLPKFIAWEPGPLWARRSKKNRPTRSKIGKKRLLKALTHTPSSLWGSTEISTLFSAKMLINCGSLGRLTNTFAPSWVGTIARCRSALKRTVSTLPSRTSCKNSLYFQVCCTAGWRSKKAEAKARTTINNRAYSPALRHFLLLPFLFTLSNS